MIAANFSELRTKLKSYLDSVEDNDETLIIKRATGKGAVMISLNHYNAIVETLHILSTKTNRDRLQESIHQMEDGQTLTKDLIEE